MMRGMWDRETVALMLIAALMPVALAIFRMVVRS